MLSVLTEFLLILFSAVGLMAIGCLFVVRCLFPPSPDGNYPFTLVPASGDARALDLTVHRLLWLRRWGFYRGRIAIVDCGLNEVGQTIVRLLCDDCDDLLLCVPSDLSHLIP